MISWIVRRPYGGSAARFIGIGRGTETQNFSMPKRRRGGKTLNWGCGTIMVNGVRAKKVLRPQQYSILRIYTPPPSPRVLMRSLMQFLDVSLKRWTLSSPKPSQEMKSLRCFNSITPPKHLGPMVCLLSFIINTGILWGQILLIWC